VRHPVIVVDLRQVTPSRVGNDQHDDVLGAELLADLERRPHRRPAEAPIGVPSSPVLRPTGVQGSPAVARPTPAAAPGSVGSGPVVPTCDSGFSGLRYWLGWKAPGISSVRRLATE